ncbi:MAG: primosomal protein N' [Clostridia bacterium]|nr:primosomal protein N' [Clostridia bacterium]
MIAKVIVDVVHSEVDKVFEYSYDVADGVLPGCRVIVPFGNREIEGIVISVSDISDFDTSKLKKIKRVLESTPALTPETLALTDFVCQTCFVPKASALRLFLPSEMRKGKIKERFVVYYSLKKSIVIEEVISTLRKSAKRQIELLQYLSENGKTKSVFLSEKFGRSAVISLETKGVLERTEEQETRSPYKGIDANRKEITLTDKQLQAVQSIQTTDKKVSLLFGVTGSGKTEVYLELIERTIKNGRTAIMLVPEIALTPQMFKQLRARFGDNAAILHSGLSAGERFDEWWRLRNGEASIAIGARSAIFAPLENLGIIIIDEEHDGSYVSESSPRYSTIDIAKFRANYCNAKLVVGSATPSIESFYSAQKGEYNYIELPDRINKKSLPKVEIADMRKEVRKGNNSYFSSILKAELEDCLKKGNQAMIFLNQRGYSKTVVCTECGHVQKCESCDVSLTYHREDDSLLCHYCGAKYKMITACTECGSRFLKYGGMGTERVVEELSKLFPNARILRMDRDTTANKEGHFKILSAFSERKADILVGTQMIAKGHDFPFVTLVGILDADASLYFSDFRSSERTFQLITQVAGRSGRAEETGKVVLQTYQPENNLLRQAIAYDYKGFFNQELSIRKATAFPPFTDIIRILISGENEQETLDVTKSIFDELKIVNLENKSKFRFFGCMKAPIKRLQNKFRFQVLMRIDANNYQLIKKMFEISDSKKTKKVNVSFEINPNNLT